MDNTFDRLFYKQGNYIGGLDESGVSDIAGPLIASCVILPKFETRPENTKIFEIDDCKLIPERYRRKHAEVIWNIAYAIGIGEAQPSEIDCIGPTNASRLAMLRAIHACTRLSNQKPVTPDFLIIDGKRQVHAKIKQVTVLEADRKSLCVAAASIVAKVYRDDIMLELHRRFPHYGWNKNKGHPCDEHFSGLDKHGMQVGIHRARFWPFAGNGSEKSADKKSAEWQKHVRRWSKRRQKWKRMTEKSLSIELGEELWTTNPQLLIHSVNSKNQLKKGAQSGKATKELKPVPKKKPTPQDCSI